MGATYTLITGASSGFGRSTALKLAPTRTLILAGRNADKLEAVRRACEGSDRHILWVRDLSRVDGLGDELASLLVAKDVNVDHFIHSAGMILIQLARATDMACVTQLFNVNLFSAMEIIRPLVQKKVNHGALRSITLISSIAPRVGASGYGVYAASKGALNAMSLSLAVELAPAIRVNTVLPGIVGTEMNRETFADPEFVSWVQATHPLGLGCPEDIADAVAFLASDSARWITGQEIVVDGGRTVLSSPPRMKVE